MELVLFSSLSLYIAVNVTLGPSMQVFTWGFNNCGQLGCGDLTSRYSPTKLNGLLGNLCTCMCILHKRRKDKNNWGGGGGGGGSPSQYLYSLWQYLGWGACPLCPLVLTPMICALVLTS